MRRPWIQTLGALALTLSPLTAAAQFTTPNAINVAGDVATTIGGTVFVNHGLVGVGRIPAATEDPFGETFGSVSGLQITEWSNNGNGTYSGTLQILPDRGYNAATPNNGNFFSDYAARIARLSFIFTPYTGAAGIGGNDFASKIAAQNQILFTSPITGTKFTYTDPVHGAGTLTSGLDPGTGVATLFNKSLPYVVSYTGRQTPQSIADTTYTINRLPIDAEALVLKADGSGYVGDEYGADIYYFNAAKQIIGAIVTPAALQPHIPAGTLNFNSLVAPSNGRRNNQGLEGVALSPDGTRLFALLQSATIQDSNSSAQNRRHTRLLVYDVSVDPMPSAPIGVYAFTLPTYTSGGNNVAVNSTAAQSEIVAIDNNRILVLSRDANGLGAAAANPSVFKSILLADLRVGGATNLAGDAAVNGEAGKITSSPGVLAAGIVAVPSTEAVNVLNVAQLGKFNFVLDLGGASQVSQLTLGEKWEGLALMPAQDPNAPNDYFLFLGNDNDFLTSVGKMIGPDGTTVTYDAFSAHDPQRQPANAGPGNVNANDTVFLVFRVTLDAAPAVTRSGFVYNRATRTFAEQVTLRNVSSAPLAGPVYLALDHLTQGVTLANQTGLTTNAPAGAPYVTVVPAGSSLAPNADTTVPLQFVNPSMGAITYDALPLVRTGNGAP